MEVVEKSISKELDFKVDFEDKKLKITISYEGEGGGASMSGHVNAEYFMDLLAEAIPGEVDDLVIGAIKAAM